MLLSGVRVVVDQAETEWINIFVTIEVHPSGWPAAKFCCHGQTQHVSIETNKNQTARTLQTKD